MKNLFVSLFALSMSIVAQPVLADDVLPFQNRSLDDDTRVEALLQELTLDEKISLLGTSLGVPRLGIAHSGHYEGLHGLTLGGAGDWNKIRKPEGGFISNPLPTTVFPQAYGLGETWDVEILRRVGDITATEARWYMQSPKSPQHSLVMRAPNADLARDPRWGRTEESFGEDAFLVGTLASAMIQGMQGPDKRYWKAASLMKHFLANSNEDGRDSTSSDFDERLFREYYSRTFYMGVKRGGAQSFMDSYNAWNGKVMMVHPCNDTIVRREWGMKGIICTDGGALNLLINSHHAYLTATEGTAAAIKVTLGQFLGRYRDEVNEALAKGLVTEKDIDRAIRGNLYTALKLGLLDAASDTQDPYRQIGTDTLAAAPWKDPEVKQYVREVTAKSVVLLKNNGILPLKVNTLKKVLVVGQWADKVEEDWYGGTPAYTVTIRQGLQLALGDSVEVLYAPNNQMGIAEKMATEADVVLVCAGNHPYGTNKRWKVSPVMSDGREAVDRKSLHLPEEELARQMYHQNKNTILVLVSSFPYTINWSDKNLPAIVHLTHCSQELGSGLADILLGKMSPAGRTTQTWVKDMLDLPNIMDYDIRHGRTYMYNERPVLYPFGYGLSYTTFDYLPSIRTIQNNKTVTLIIKVQNTGSVDADEVVQVYASYPSGWVQRPKKQLCAFSRVAIKAGETREVTLVIDKEDLSYWDVEARKFVVDPGVITLSVGGSSADVRQMIDVDLRAN